MAEQIQLLWDGRNNKQLCKRKNINKTKQLRNRRIIKPSQTKIH